MKYFILILLFSKIANATTLEVGQTKFFKAAPDAKINITPSKLVELSESDDGIQIKAKHPGRLQLKIDSELRNIRILSAGTGNFHQQMKALSLKMLGPKVQMSQGQTQVSGQLHRLSDWQSFFDLARARGRGFQLTAIIDQDVQANFRQELSLILKSAGVSSFNLLFRPQPLIEISAEHEKDKAEIAKVLGPTGVAFRFNTEQLSLKPLVDIKIVVAEITSSFQSDIGIDWPTQITAEVNNRFTSHEKLLATLKLAQARGDGQVLASPHVVARSGGEAEFLAGGELPIRIVSRFSKGIQWKRHGIFLKIKPLADQDQNISLNLEAEVSMPDSGYSVDNIPAMKTNKVSSQFDMKAQSTIVLSGLIQNLNSLNEQSVAGLAKIPILGEFFKSRSKRKTRTELVIFVTPEIRAVQPELKPKAPGGWEGDFEHL